MEPIAPAMKDVAWRYLQFHLYEHAAFTGKTPVDGVFEYPWFTAYWQAGTQRWAFWTRIGDDIAALAMVRHDDEDGRFEMAEFFVVNRYRGLGLADRFAKDVILRFNGSWKLNLVVGDARATAFWRRVLGEIADYAESPLDRGDGVERIEQRFTV